MRNKVLYCILVACLLLTACGNSEKVFNDTNEQILLEEFTELVAKEENISPKEAEQLIAGRKQEMKEKYMDVEILKQTEMRKINPYCTIQCTVFLEVAKNKDEKEILSVYVSSVDVIDEGYNAQINGKYDSDIEEGKAVVYYTGSIRCEFSEEQIKELNISKEEIIYSEDNKICYGNDIKAIFYFVI